MAFESPSPLELMKVFDDWPYEAVIIARTWLRPEPTELKILVAEPLRVDSDSIVDVVNCAEGVVFHLGGSTRNGSATKISARRVASRKSSQESKLC